jgi:hypothetical protein
MVEGASSSDTWCHWDGLVQLPLNELVSVD